MKIYNCECEDKGRKYKCEGTEQNPQVYCQVELKLKDLSIGKQITIIEEE